MTYRFRLRFTFWLDMQKADEAALAETIDTLKRERTFVSTIRDGIRLMCDLRAGRTEVLWELFPWVKEATQPVSSLRPDQRLHDQVARLEALLLTHGNSTIQPPLQTAPKNSKPLVEITPSPGKTSAEVVAKNFLSSMKGLASGFFD